MKRVNTRVVLVKKVGKWSGGFDTEEEINQIPKAILDVSGQSVLIELVSCIRKTSSNRFHLSQRPKAWIYGRPPGNTAALPR
jgi:hypothetical protein